MQMKKIIAIIAVLLVFAFLFGCLQKPSGGQPSSQGQSNGQSQVTAKPVEDIGADALENDIPGGEENLTNLDDALLNFTS
jgi:PBP1b-binding outer membrane lipoprotein LpoB